MTKTQPAAAAEYAARYGLRAVGENRVQEGIDKRAQTAAAVRWELIGHLQSNKAALAARHFDRIQSVDGEKLLNGLDRASSELGIKLPILLQINAGRDPAKFGAEPADAPRLLEAALAKKTLAVDGLMTIAPLSDDPAVARASQLDLGQLQRILVEALQTGHPAAATELVVRRPQVARGRQEDLDQQLAGRLPEELDPVGGVRRPRNSADEPRDRRRRRRASAPRGGSSASAWRMSPTG